MVADAGRAVFFRRDVPYRVSHPDGHGDRCTVLRYSRDVLRDAVGAYDPQAAEQSGSFFRFSHCPADRQVYQMQTRFRTRRPETDRTDGSADELGIRILDSVLCAAYAAAGVHPPKSSPVTARVHREIADGTRTLLARRFRERLTLQEIARAVHCSPFHLARIFRREVGSSLHRHVTSLRLRAALERLADGEGDLTALALELGFSSHSHFTDAFRREFGIAPRDFRGSLSRSREKSKILKV